MKLELESPLSSILTNSHSISEKTNEESQTLSDSSITELFETLKDYFKSDNFAALLEVKEVLSLSLVSKSFHRIFNERYVQLVIRLGNLNGSLRYLFWINQAPYAKYAKIYI